MRLACKQFGFGGKFALGAQTIGGDQGLISSMGNMAANAAAGVSTGAGPVSVSSQKAIFDKMANETASLNRNAYTTEGRANIRKSSLMDSIGNDLNKATKTSISDATEPIKETGSEVMGSGFMAGGSALGGKIASSMGANKETGKLVGSIGGSFVPALFSERNNHMNNKYYKQSLFASLDDSDLGETAKDIGNGVGGVVGGIGGAAAGMGLGALIGGGLGHLNTRRQVNSALNTANEAQGSINQSMQQANIKAGDVIRDANGNPILSKTGREQKYTKRQQAQVVNEANQNIIKQQETLKGLGVQGNAAGQSVTVYTLSSTQQRSIANDAAKNSTTFNKQAETFVNDFNKGGKGINKTYQNLSNDAVKSVKATAKKGVMIGGGRGAAIGMLAGGIIGGMGGSEKGSSIFSKVYDEPGTEQRNYIAIKELPKAAKEIGGDILRHINNNKKEYISNAITWGGGGALAAYGIDKAISHDAKKVGIMPSKKNTMPTQNQYSGTSSIMSKVGKVLKESGQIAKDEVINLAKHPKSLIMPAAFAAIPAIGYVSQRAAVKKSSQSQMPIQTNYTNLTNKAVGSIKKGLKFAREMVWNPEGAKKAGKELSEIGAKQGHKYTQKFGNWINDDKAGFVKKAGIGLVGAQVAFAPMVVGGDIGTKITRKGLETVDKNAFEYEKHQNQMIQ